MSKFIEEFYYRNLGSQARSMKQDNLKQNIRWNGFLG